MENRPPPSNKRPREDSVANAELRTQHRMSSALTVAITSGSLENVHETNTENPPSLLSTLILRRTLGEREWIRGKS